MIVLSHIRIHKIKNYFSNFLFGLARKNYSWLQKCNDVTLHMLTVIKTAEKHANHSATNISFIFWGIYSRMPDFLMFNYGFYNILLGLIHPLFPWVIRISQQTHTNWVPHESWSINWQWYNFNFYVYLAWRERHKVHIRLSPWNSKAYQLVYLLINQQTLISKRLVYLK